MGQVLRQIAFFFGSCGLAAAAFATERSDDEGMRQQHASAPMKVRGKKTHSEIDSTPGPSDAKFIFNNANDSLKNIPKSKSLMYQPERILGLPSTGIPLTLDNQIQ